MRTMDQIIDAINEAHGELMLAPGELLMLAKQIVELSEEIDRLHDAAFNARCDHD
jgi:hypothetical protein